MPVLFFIRLLAEYSMPSRVRISLRQQETGEVMTYRGGENKAKKMYQIGVRFRRQRCYFGECAKSRKKGRKILRNFNQEFREHLQKVQVGRVLRKHRGC